MKTNRRGFFGAVSAAVVAGALPCKTKAAVAVSEPEITECVFGEAARQYVSSKPIRVYGDLPDGGILEGPDGELVKVTRIG